MLAAFLFLPYCTYIQNSSQNLLLLRLVVKRMVEYGWTQTCTDSHGRESTEDERNGIEYPTPNPECPIFNGRGKPGEKCVGIFGVRLEMEKLWRISRRMLELPGGDVS